MTETSITRARAAYRASQRSRGRWRRSIPLALASLPLLLFLLLPLVALMLRVNLERLLANLRDSAVTQAIGLSLITTALTVLITVVAGTPVAYLLARRRFRGRTALDTLIDLPMVLPPSVAGIALLVAFGRRGLLGQYISAAGLEIAFTQVAVVLAQTFVAAPFYVKAAVAGFAGVDRDLEQAAALDGAAPPQIFRYVTLPLAWTALFGGAVMTWARALGEFGATIIFAGNFPGRTQTMPLAIYLGFELELNVALTLSVILLGTSFAVLFVVKGVLRQHIKA
ncbi:MAG TPA: ABC transporter permease [Roseiflexaceae bacterium]